MRLDGGRALLLAAALAAGVPPAGAATVRFDYPALERIIVLALLTDGGRLYLDGSPESECRHAFIQQPRVGAEAGRLHVTFLFSGRQGARVAGRCVGPGGTFDIRVSGVPRFAAGEIYLDELEVESLGRGGRLFALVAPLLESQLGARLRYPLEDVLARLAHDLSTAHGVALSFEDVEVGGIDAGDTAIRMSFDADAIIR